MKSTLSAILMLVATSAGAQDAAALAAFETIVKPCQVAFETQDLTRIFYNERVKSWVQVVSTRGQVKYDVQRTNSLVTPFQGKIVVTQQTASGRADSEDAAKALTLDAATGSTLTETLEYGFQDGSWKLLFTGVDDHRGTRIRNPANPSAPPRRGPIASCMKY